MPRWGCRPTKRTSSPKTATTSCGAGRKCPIFFWLARADFLVGAFIGAGPTTPVWLGMVVVSFFLVAVSLWGMLVCGSEMVQYAVLHRACQIGKWAATSPAGGSPARAERWRASSWQLPAGKRRFFREDFPGSKSKKSLNTAATPRLRREQDVIGTRSGSSAAGADRCWFEL